MQRNIVLGVFGLEVVHSAVHKTTLNEKLVFVEIEVVPLKRRHLAHANTEALGYLYHRAPRLLQCRNDEFELLHSERSRALPALVATLVAKLRSPGRVRTWCFCHGILGYARVEPVRRQVELVIYPAVQLRYNNPPGGSHNMENIVYRSATCGLFRRYACPTPAIPQPS